MLSPRHLRTASVASLFLSLAIAVAFAQGDRRDRVSYTTFRPGNWDIFRFSEPGAPPERLTADPGLDYDPVVSPDGRWLVFCSERLGSPDLFALDLLRGGEPRLLIESEALEDQAALSPDGKTLAFVGTSAGNADLYRVPFLPGRTLTMTDAENLTRTSAGEFRPAFSPDGHTLAFSSDRDSQVLALSSIVRLRHGDIYTMDIESRRTKRVTDWPGWDGSPSWSSDAKRIVFYRGEPRTASNWRETRTRIWMMDADGTNQRVLTPGETTALSPEVTPDGRIVYSRKSDDRSWQLVSIATDGSGQRLESPHSTVNYWKPARVGRTNGLVAHGTASVRSPQVDTGRPRGGPDLGEGPFIAGGSPLRKRLPDREIDLYAIRYFSAFVHPVRDLALLMTPPAPSDVILSRLDGTGQHRIFQFDASGGSLSSASWSRDGEWIALTRGNAFRVDGNSDIWKMRADGSALQNLTADSLGNESFPSFSPDGGRLVFRSGRAGRFDLYVMNSDGSDVRQLTREPGNVTAPVFSPNGRQIVFLSTRDNPGVPLYEVYVADIDARGEQTRLVRVTDNAVQEGHVAVSHDGQWIIFSSEQGGISDEEPLVQSVIFAPQMYGEMYAYRITNGALVRLTHNKWEEGVPSWERATSR